MGDSPYQLVQELFYQQRLPRTPIPNHQAWKDRDLSSELIEAFKILDENSDGISAREAMGEEIRKELMNSNILRDVDC